MRSKTFHSIVIVLVAEQSRLVGLAPAWLAGHAARLRIILAVVAAPLVVAEESVRDARSVNFHRLHCVSATNRFRRKHKRAQHKHSGKVFSRIHSQCKNLEGKCDFSTV